MNLFTEKGDNFVYSDKENMYVAKQQYDDNIYIGKWLETSSEDYVATLSDINDNRTNNGGQIFTMLK